MKYLLVCLVLLTISCSIYPTGQEIIDSGRLTEEEFPSPESIDDCYRWIYYNIMYTPDTSEDWQSPVDTLISRSGDCEDQVILFIWLVSMYFSKQGDMAIFSVENNINHAVALIDGQYYDFNNILSNYETQEILRINYKTIMAFIEDK